MDRKKYLIINADDYGIAEETNQAVVELMKDKKITSTSLLAVGRFYNDAVEKAKANGIKVGVHLAFNSDFPEDLWQAIGERKSISSLIDDKNNLPKDKRHFARYARSRHVDYECNSQYDLIENSGLTIDHIDNHCGTLYGINGRLFFINAFRFCKLKGMPYRFPKKINFLKDVFPKGVPSYAKVAHRLVLKTASMYKVRLIDDMITNPYKIDEIESYNALEEFYLKKIQEMEDGVTELFLHPSYDCPLYNSNKEWKKRIYELEFLHSERLSNLIKDEGIELVTYSKLMED